MKNLRFFKDKGKTCWVDITPMVAEKVFELQEQFSSTVLLFPEKGEHGVRIDVEDFEEIMSTRRVKDKDGNVTRIEVTILNTTAFSKEFCRCAVKKVCGFDVDGKKIEETADSEVIGKVLAIEENTIWVIAKIAEAEATFVKEYGGRSALKN